MKKLYIIALCCAVGATAADAHQRFVSKRHTDKAVTVTVRPDGSRRLAVAAAKAEVWRPASQTEYIYNGEDWDEMGTVNFKYDNRGNNIEESFDEDGVISTTVRTYDQNDMVTSILTTYTEEGVTENSEKRTYVYDPIVTDFYTQRLGYSWMEGEWVKNYYCEDNDITRNASNHITTIVKSLPLGDDMLPAYKSVWSYDAATGKADRFDYYTNYSGADEAWELDENLSYRDIVWDATDGQMTTHINELLSGANRVKQYSVYYEDELDGHVFVEYSAANPDDYLLKSTYADPSEVGLVSQVETIDANGSKRITDTEYFDYEGNVTASPTYQSVETIMCDSYGNVVSDELKEAYDGGDFELVMGEKYDITYDAKGNPTEIILSVYSFDDDEYFPDTRIVYGDYTDVSLGIDDVTAADDADAPVEYFNLQGVRVDNPQSGLYIRRQGNSVTKVYL